MEGKKLELTLRIFDLMQEKSRAQGSPVTFYAVAKATGLSQGRLRAYAENRVSRFDKYTLEQLGAYFGCRPTELFK